MKAYFAVNGIGLGHIKRCEILAEKLIEEGWQVFFSTYLDGYEYASSKGFKVLHSTPLSYVVDNMGRVDYKATLLCNGLSIGFRRFLNQIAEEVRHIKAIKPDIVVSDSRASTIIAAKLIGLPVILIVNQIKVEMAKTVKPESMAEGLLLVIVRFSWFILKHLLEYLWTLSDKILIPDFPPPYTISKNNLGAFAYREPKAKIVFTGPLVRREPNLTYGPSFKPAEERPLIYVAVSGPKRERRILISKLVRIIPEISEYRFILTEGEPSQSRSRKEMGNLIIYPWVEDEVQLSLLQSCNLVICRAGHGTITKALAYGKPMILIPVPGHTEQMGNAMRVKELGFGEVIDQERLNVAVLRETIERVLESSLKRSSLIPGLRRDPVKEFLKIIRGSLPRKVNLVRPVK